MRLNMRLGYDDIGGIVIKSRDMRASRGVVPYRPAAYHPAAYHPVSVAYCPVPVAY